MMDKIGRFLLLFIMRFSRKNRALKLRQSQYRNNHDVCDDHKVMDGIFGISISIYIRSVLRASNSASVDIVFIGHDRMEHYEMRQYKGNKMTWSNGRPIKWGLMLVRSTGFETGIHNFCWDTSVWAQMDGMSK